jgi:hypothetical protein
MMSASALLDARLLIDGTDRLDCLEGVDAA